MLCRLYRAQRLYVQLLPKSMLIAILIGNGIRLQSTIGLCPEKLFFHVVFYKTQWLYVHFGKILGAQRLYVHNCALRESVDMLLFMTSVATAWVSPKILGFSIQPWVLGFL